MRTGGGASETAGWVNVFATKPNDLSTASQDPHDGARDVDSCKWSLDLHLCTLAHVCPHTHSHTHKQMNLNAV